MREEEHLIISDHTRKFLKEEHHFPGPLIDRQTHASWESNGSPELSETALLKKKNWLNLTHLNYSGGYEERTS